MPFPFAKDIQPLVVSSPTGGLNDTSSIDGLADNEATLALNVDFDRGTIANRRGSIVHRDQIQSPDLVSYWRYHYRRRDGSGQLLGVNGTHLYRDTGTNWVGVISGTNPGGASDVFGGGNRLGTSVQYNDWVYYADGDVYLRYESTGPTIQDGSYQGGTSPAPTLLNQQAAAGNLGAGTYSIVFILYDPVSGEKTNPSIESNQITAVALDKWDVTINAVPGWTSNFSRIQIFRTVVNGAGAWFFEKEITIPGGWNLATTPLTTADESNLYISVEDSDLGSEVEYDNDPIPPGIRVIVMHDERVMGIGATASPSTVYWTKKGQPWSWPTANGQDLLKDDGHPAVSLFVMYGNVFAWKRGGPGFQLQPHPTLGYSPQQLPARHGCESHHSVLVDENDAFWVDKDGLIRFNGQQTVNISDAKIRQTMATITSSNEALVVTAYGILDKQPDRRQLQWVFSSLTPGVQDTVLIQEMDTGAWHIEQYGTGTSGFRVYTLVQDDNYQEWVYAADGNGYTYRTRTNTARAELYSDTGASIPMKWYSKWFGDGVIDNMLRWIDVEHEVSGPGLANGDITVKVWADGDDSTTIISRTFPLYATGNKTKVTRFDLPARYWKRFRIGFEHDAVDGNVSIVKFVVWAFPVAARLIGA